jgi:hypothetical protein
MSKTDYVYLKVPRDAWDLLEETLCMDAESSAFDEVLRQEISDALSQVEVLK